MYRNSIQEKIPYINRPRGRNIAGTYQKQQQRNDLKPNQTEQKNILNSKYTMNKSSHKY